ncbi:polymorphic toxin-type HINT domain-containing protein [Streptomyces sp. NPDC005899]|uniref:polymorphic toxin-type HINT domain-containing protein n=1 Tax=Streptomyces sp. NPDC005899 TaxID=3155716 RepID=UPI0033F438F5
MLNYLRHVGHWRRSIPLALLLVMFIGFIPEDPAAAGTGKLRLEDLKRDPSIPGRSLHPKRKSVRNDATTKWAPPRDRDLAGTYSVQVSRGGKAPSPKLSSGSSHLLGSSGEALDRSPVRLIQPTVKEAKAARTAGTARPAPVGGAAQVKIQNQKTARKAGVTGMLLTAAPAATSEAKALTGAVEFEIDYTAVKDTYGADFGSRLRLVQLPACALTTPDKAQCRTRTELGGDNDPATGTVSATVELTATDARSAGSPMVLAAVAAASGPGGSHEATSLSPSGDWSGGSSAGGFSWSYGIESPEVPGGPEPEVELSYSSQSVDGRTASTNGQSSWIAEGWEYEPGFVERRYQPCSDDKAAIDGKAPNNSGETADLCWGSDHVVMSLDGKTTELVKNEPTPERPKEEWRLADDDGTRVERRTGADNGAKDGEYWLITSTDGVQYSFGLNKLPGATTQRTNSALTVPVFGNHPGEPCHATAFADSDCAQAYRWNLDYVVDPLGDAMTLWWNKHTNFYGQHMKADQQISYVRSADLGRIDYGLRSDALFGVLPAGRTTFTTAERCIPNSTFDCAEAKRTTANAKYWPDTPLDQECVSGAKCTDKYSPTFWSTKRLTKISTQVLDGSALADADSWTLEQSYPATGDGSSPALWLESITRTGYGAGGTASMPKVSFAGTQMDNRVDGVEGLPPFSRMRIHAIDTETGGRIGVTYSPRECSALAPRKMPASPETNTLRCYPQYWMPKGATKPIQDWFHLYTATQVREDDLVTDSPDTVTSYEFIGSPAWAYDDREFTESKQRTWSQYRGYERVRTRTGTATDVGELTEKRYFRGMHGDKLPTGTRTASVEDSSGGTALDLPQHRGQLREQITYESDGGPIDTATLTTAWAVKTAERKRAGTTPLQAWMGNPETVTTRERVKGDTWRTSKEVTSYDTYGLPTQVDETTRGGKRYCSKISYARNTTAHMLESVSRDLTRLGSCDSSSGEVVEDTRTLYDGKAFGAAPTKGLATEVQELDADGTGYVTIDKTEYDIHGRETASWDAENRKTSVTITPTTRVPASKSVTTDPLLHTETTEYDNVRGLPVKTTDANDKSSTMQYDPLGRLLKVWNIGRDPATQTPNASFDYTVRRDGPTVITNRALKDNGEYAVSYEIMDGLLRERQTQDEAVAGAGRIVNDTFYDSAGRPWKENEGYFNDQEPAAALLTVGDQEVPSQTRTFYDGLGQPTHTVTYARGVEQTRTSTEHDGDATTTVPPKGGTVITEFTDAEGRLARTREYSKQDRSEWRDVSYEYDALDQITTITGPTGSTTFEYDSRGRQTAFTDPDAGRTEIAYDNTDNVISMKDARGNVLVPTYDDGGRQTSLREGTPDGPKRLEWTYDTLYKGLPTAAIRYDNGHAYRDEITAYDSAYRPTTMTTTIPAEETGFGGTYTYKNKYTATGKLEWSDVPAVGGLAAEHITFWYNSDGLPISIRGAASYLNDVQYSAFGEILRTDSGVATKKVYGTYFYDEFTRRMTQSIFDRSVTPGRITDTRYSYDEAGNVTKVSDTPGEAAADAGKTDTQCFVYDQLRQMTSAWTAKTDDCATGPSKDTVGGPDPYWQSYAFDTAGNRTQLTDRDTTGDTSKNVTRTYTYGKTGIGGPNALAEVKSTGPQGTDLSTFGYDKSGNTTTRQVNGTTQSLEWDVEGQLRKVTEPIEGGGSKSTGYLYDASGERLVRTDSDGSKTLYLGEVEVTLKTDGLTRTAERFYAHPDGATTVRSTGGGRQLLLSDHHGTSTTSVDMASTDMRVTRRKSMPFGEDRGAQPSTWPGMRGFVGGTVDPDTGLTRLGARDYDPVTGRFISVDPLADYGRTSTMNPYSYSNNAPATFSDPDGLSYNKGKGGGYGPRGHDRGEGANALGTWLQQWLMQQWRERQERERQRRIAEARRKAAEAKRKAEERARRLAALRRAAAEAAAARKMAREMAAAQARAAKRAAAQAAANKRAALRQAAARKRAEAQRAEARRQQARRAAARKAAARTRPSAKPSAAARPKPRPSQVTKPAQQRKPNATGCRTGNSFLPATKVLMSDGSKKPISQVKVGDKLLATDPKTGKTSVETASATIVGAGTKKLAKITLSQQQDGRLKKVSVTATDGHPFWVPSLGIWITATNLFAGLHLQSMSGAAVQVESVSRWNETATVHNLTITDTHTYYVQVGDESILVHNSGTQQCQVEVTIDKATHPESAQHIEDAQQAGHPAVLTINRAGSKKNRQDSLRGIPKVPNKQLDEYPPAMFKEGGAGASVRAISGGDNGGAGARIGNSLRRYPNGTRVRIKVVDSRTP